MEAKVVGETYPAVRDDGEGCMFGRTSRSRADACGEKMREQVKGVERKVDRMTWALVIAALTLAVNVLRSVLVG